MPTVLGAPASSVANTPGWPSVGTFVTCSKPASRSMLHHQVAAFLHAAILGGDRRLANPVLQPLDGFVVTFVGLGKERLQVALVVVVPERFVVVVIGTVVVAVDTVVVVLPEVVVLEEAAPEVVVVVVFGIETCVAEVVGTVLVGGVVVVCAPAVVVVVGSARGT